MIIEVAIVEDNKETRDEFEKLIRANDQFYCAGVFASAEDFLRSFKVMNVQVVLMDIELPGMSGIECILNAFEIRKNVSFLICSTFEDEDKIFPAIEVGARGYLVKRDKENLYSAIMDIIEHRAHMSAPIAEKVMQKFRSNAKDMKLYYNLTPRERETVDLLKQGFPYKIIAKQMGISIHTVRANCYNIYEILGAKTRGEALNKIFP